jgi:hydrogenase maturation factor HypE
MFNNYILWVIVSLILIRLVHYLYSYFIDTLTVPKIKDLVIKPTQEYKDIQKIIQSNNNIININNQNSDDTTNIDSLVTKDTQKTMKNELKNFFNELSYTNINKSNTENSYSNY